MAQGRRVAGITVARGSRIEGGTGDSACRRSQCAGPSRHGRCLGIPPHCEVLPSSLPHALLLRASGDRSSYPTSRRAQTYQEWEASTTLKLRRSSGSAASVAQSMTQAMGGHTSALEVSFGGKADAYNLTRRIRHSQASPHAPSRIPGRIRHAAFKKRSGPRCAPRSAPENGPAGGSVDPGSRPAWLRWLCTHSRPGLARRDRQVATRGRVR